MKGWRQPKNRPPKGKGAARDKPPIKTYVPHDLLVPKPINRIRIFPSSDGYSLILELSDHTPDEHKADCDAVCVGRFVMPWQQMEFLGQSMLERVVQYKEALSGGEEGPTAVSPEGDASNETEKVAAVVRHANRHLNDPPKLVEEPVEESSANAGSPEDIEEATTAGSDRV